VTVRRIEGELPVAFRYTPGVGNTVFFEALRDRGTFLGSRCADCGVTYVPARIFCERCLAGLVPDTECGPEGPSSRGPSPQDVDGTAARARRGVRLVRLDGADTVVLHRLLGTADDRWTRPGRPATGSHGSIHDLEGFEPRMNFDLTDEQEQLRALVREFAEKEVAPGAAERRSARDLPDRHREEDGRPRALRAPDPQEYGGSDADAVTWALVMEELGRVDSSVAVTLSVASGLAGGMVTRSGPRRRRSGGSPHRRRARCWRDSR
jgi:hypothetical protein